MSGGVSYTVVLTSCGRFDLLEQTLRSFFQYADIPPEAFIVIEDSGDESVRTVLEKFDFPFQLIINPQQLGQDRSIDKAYSKVKTPLVFHCEDDWEFTRGGFIEKSTVLLRALPKASCIMLRAREEFPAEFKDVPAQELNGVSYYVPPENIDKKFFGYSYNPGLRRLSDFQNIAPVSKIGNEKEVSYLFRRLGYKTVHLEPQSVVHTGDEQSTYRPPPREKKFPFIKKRIKRHWTVYKYLVLQKLRGKSNEI